MEDIMIPYGMANYEEIKLENYVYIDKTEYIKKIERNGKYLVLLRPRRFGKSLFLSTLANYYDVNKADKFDALFGDAYIGQNPTKLKNSYYILKFNFSGLNTNNLEDLQRTFLKKVKNSLTVFLRNYNLTDKVELDNKETFAASVLETFFNDIEPYLSKPIYVLIDEYDQFANELLGFHSDIFSTIVSENGFVRKFYEILKNATETSVIDRIFITGVSPITLDSMASGFNITDSLTCDRDFNDVMGFTKDEVKHLMKTVLDENIYKEQFEEILKEMQYNYDGYMFSKDAQNTVYNSTNCMYYLKNYIQFNEPPEKPLDINVANYTNLYKIFVRKVNTNSKDNFSYLEEIVCNKELKVSLTNLFTFEKKFNKYDFLSLLFYLGFLTISGERDGSLVMKVPNHSIQGLYFELFFETLIKRKISI